MWLVWEDWTCASGGGTRTISQFSPDGPQQFALYSVPYPKPLDPYRSPIFPLTPPTPHRPVLTPLCPSPLADAHPTDFSKTLFAGQDYNNARVLDFQQVDHYVNNMVSILETPRMPWHDVSLFSYQIPSSPLVWSLSVSTRVPHTLPPERCSMRHVPGLGARLLSFRGRLFVALGPPEPTPEPENALNLGTLQLDVLTDYLPTPQHSPSSLGARLLTR